MLNLALAGFLFVQASPTEVELETGETQEIALRAANISGEVTDFELSVKVVPQERGRFEDGKFIAGEPGPGLIIFEVSYKGETGVEAIPIRVNRSGEGISPKEAVLQVGDTLKFSVKQGTPEEWRIMPPWLGKVEDGVFVAKSAGKGVITVKTDQGFCKAKIVVEGEEAEMIELYPAEAVLFAGESVSFSVTAGASYSIDPADLGEVSDEGVFKATRPGNGLIWATWEEDGQPKTAKAFVRVLPAIFLVPGQTMELPLPGKAKAATVEVTGKGLSAEVSGGKLILKGQEAGFGVLTLSKGKGGKGKGEGKEKFYPFIVGEKLISLGQREVKLKPGDEFKPMVFSSATSGSASLTYKVIPSEAGWMDGGVFHAGDWKGSAWLVGAMSADKGGAGGFVHLIITGGD